MARNGSGTMSLTQTFTADTDATAEDVNDVLGDIADEISNSIAKDGQTTITNQLKGFAGTVSAPGYAFSSDLDCGLYRIGANNIGLAVNGGLVLDIATTGASITGTITPSGQIVGSAGSVSAPSYSFTSDLNTGIYWIGADNIGVAVGGTKILDVASTGLSVTGTLTPSGQIVSAAGTVGAPGVSFASDLDCGLYRIGANNIGAAVNGAKVLDIATTGLAVTGSLTSTSSLGYATGAGGTVTQATNKSTGVTINTLTGQITTNNATLNAGAEVAFTVTNSAVAATDVVIANIASGATAASYDVGVTAVSAGSFAMTLTNLSASNLSEALVINYAIIKGVSS